MPDLSTLPDSAHYDRVVLHVVQCKSWFKACSVVLTQLP